MGILVNSSDVKAIKHLWLILHVLALTSGLVGLSGWFITPFLTKDIQSDKWHQVFRWTSIIGGLSCGGISLSSSLVLSSLEPRINALNKYELAQFKHSVASQLFLAQQTNSAIASSLFAEQKSSLCNQSMELWNSNDDKLPGDSLPGWGSRGTLQRSITETELHGQNDAVLIALKDGVPDSEIVKNVMGYGGRRYQEGKEILEAIKAEVLQQEGNRDEDEETVPGDEG